MTDGNVFLFYPNLIGYARIVLAIFSFHAMVANPWYAAGCYFLSGMLDAFDGYLARAFNQSSRFGAMLDQLTDRCTFVALLMALCHLYSSLIFPFQVVVVLDIASHWMHLHSADITGKNTHKFSENRILNYYYTSRTFLFFMCFGNEAFYGLLYIGAFWIGPSVLGIRVVYIITALLFPVALLKSIINGVHLITASQTIVAYDHEKIKSN